MSNVSADLRASIEGLYEAFSAYSLPKYTDPCLHCHTLDDEAKLHSKPLRQLDVAELRDYAFDALLVWGGVDDFKHFLPRVFELYVMVPDTDVTLIDPEIIVRKVRHGKWHTWPASEQDAVRTFLHALWADVLADAPDMDAFLDVESWLCAIAQAEDDLSPYLVQWMGDQSLSATLALSALLLGGAVMNSSCTGQNAFWNDRNDQYAQVLAWVRTPRVLEKLRHARATFNEPTSAAEIEAAIQMLNQA